MKISLTIFLFLLLLSPVFAQKDSYYLDVPKDLPKEVVDDYIFLLNNVTGNQWKEKFNSTTSAKGITLKISDHPQFKSKESFRLQSDGIKNLTITSSSNEGLIFGLYKHLRSLGLRFYLPGELYTILPSVTNPFGAKKDIIDGPFLQVRNFFGTGGFGTDNPDPDRSVERSWNQWKLRNGFGSAYQLGGHRGENFILENLETLRQHPDWLASPLSNNIQTDQQIKLNYLNRKALDFYIDWTIKPFTSSAFRLPPKGHTEFQSIEPSDGGGYLNEQPGNSNKNLPSVSDQVFHAANLAAKKLDLLFPNHPNIGVNLYAYSSHAEPPSFPLHPRVFVQLIPYQFQNIAFGPSFISLWAEKVKRFGLYDYFKYADAQFDLPGGITLEETMKRLVHSVRAGSEGTSFETSYSKFSTGVPLWVIGRYMTEGNADWEKNLEQLTSDLYGNAASSISGLFTLFYQQPSFNLNLMGNAVNYVHDASHSSNKPIVTQRINELKQYLQFVHLAYQSRDQKTGNLNSRSKPVAEYAWKLYESGIIHSYRIMQLVSYSFLNVERNDPDWKSYQQLHADWFPETPRQKATWSIINQGISPGQTEKDFQSLYKKYSNSVSIITSSNKEQEKELKSFNSIKKLTIGGDATARGYFGISGSKNVNVRIRYILKGEPKLTLSLIDQNFNSPKALILNKQKGETSFTLPAGESTVFINTSGSTSYRMEISIENGAFFFDGSPRGIMAFYKSLEAPYEQYTYEPDYYPSYVFIPSKTSNIDYKVQLNQLAIYTPDKKIIKSKLLQSEHGGLEYRRFDIDPKNSGKFWKAVISGNYNYAFLNIPDRYYLLKEK